MFPLSAWHLVKEVNKICPVDRPKVDNSKSEQIKIRALAVGHGIGCSFYFVIAFSVRIWYIVGINVLDRLHLKCGLLNITEGQTMKIILL